MGEVRGRDGKNRAPQRKLLTGIKIFGDGDLNQAAGVIRLLYFLVNAEQCPQVGELWVSLRVPGRPRT